MRLVNLDEQRKLYESSMSRIRQHLEEDDIATITSFITEDNDRRINNKNRRSKKQNKKTNKELGEFLHYLKYSYVRVKGYYKEEEDERDSEGNPIVYPPVYEESFFVIKPAGRSLNAFVKDMTNFAKKYEQESVIIWNHETKEAAEYHTRDFQNYEVKRVYAGFSINTVQEIAWTQYKKDWFVFGEEIDSDFVITEVEENFVNESDRTKISSLMSRRKDLFGDAYY